MSQQNQTKIKITYQQSEFIRPIQYAAPSVRKGNIYKNPLNTMVHYQSFSKQYYYHLLKTPPVKGNQSGWILKRKKKQIISLGLLFMYYVLAPHTTFSSQVRSIPLWAPGTKPRAYIHPPFSFALKHIFFFVILTDILGMSMDLNGWEYTVHLLPTTPTG